MSYCIGSACKKHNQCAIHINNAPANNAVHILDWSTMGYGMVSGWGHKMNIEHYCGDNSDDYPKFTPLTKDEHDAKD